MKTTHPIKLIALAVFTFGGLIAFLLLLPSCATRQPMPDFPDALSVGEEFPPVWPQPPIDFSDCEFPKSTQTP